MTDREPKKSEQIFARKGLATPSPGTERDLDSLNLHAAPRSTERDPAPTSSLSGPVGEEPAPAGSLLSVDMRKHTGRAWIEAQKADPTASPDTHGLPAEVSATLLIRQGNLPLESTAGERSPGGSDAWRRLRHELDSEIASLSERDESQVRTLPSWAEIKESLAKEIEPSRPAPQAEAGRARPVAPEAPPREPEGLFAAPPNPTEAAPSGALEGRKPAVSDRAEPPVSARPADQRPVSEEAPQVPSTAGPGLVADTKAAAEPAVIKAAPRTVSEAIRPESAPNDAAHAGTARLDFGREEPYAKMPPPLYPARKSSHTGAAVLGFIAMVAIGAGLWYQLGGGRLTLQRLGLSPDVSVAIPPRGAEQPEPATAAAEGEPAEATGAEAVAGPSEAPQEAAAPQQPTPQAVGAASGDATGESPPAVASTPAVEPSFDLIRVEPNGEAVIAGRAAPDTNLILLDNGKPIGTARANAAGEWAFIPERPLAPGEHHFSMVVNTPQGEVVLPDRRGPTQIAPVSGDPAPEAARDSAPAAASPAAPSRPEPGSPESGEGGAPASELVPADESPSAPSLDIEAEPQQAVGEAEKRSDSSLAGLPTPKSKPTGIVTENTAPYGIQLSSYLSQEAALESWRDLQRRFPDLLGDKQLLIQEATLEAGGIRFRVQTGFFESLGAARKLCQRFEQQEQDCLVFRR